MTARSLMILSLGLLAGCGSIDSRIYDESDPPRLRDGEVLMYTYWHPGNEELREERILRVREGVASCELKSPARGRLVGEIPEGLWVRLWNDFLDAGVFDSGQFSVSQDDVTSGSPYHLVRLALGERRGSFSSQFRQDLLIFTSKSVVSRLQWTNRIVDLVSEHAKEQVEAPSQPEAGERKPRTATPDDDNTPPEVRAGGETGGD